MQGELTCGAAPDLLDLLTLERIDDSRYRAAIPIDDKYGLYGGQVAAQALRAASHTVSSRHRAHSFHSYFLRRGDPAEAVTYAVDRDRDGRSYSSRRVRAFQDGRCIFTMAASFHVPESGPDVQTVAMPIVAFPESLGPFRATRAVSIEFRDPGKARDIDHPATLWARTTVPVGDDPHLQACVLAYVSDMFTGMYTLDIVTPEVTMFSLDHAMWFYRPAQPSNWMLMDLVPESVAAGRGMYRGHLFSAEGVLLAGLAQEGLFRTRGGSTWP